MIWTVGLVALAAVMAGLLRFVGLEVTFPHGVQGAVGHTLGAVLFGVIVIGLLRLVARPWLKSWEEQPVRIWVVDRAYMVSTPFSERFVVPVHLENRSESAAYQCALSVVAVSDDVTFAVPRLVSTVVLPPNSELPVDLVYWDRRNPPLIDGDRLNIVSPPATFAEGMLAPLPIDPHQIELEVWVQDRKPARALCRVWVDAARMLRLEEVPFTARP